jgi:hypothetical protein
VLLPKSDKSKFLSLVGFTQENPDALETAIRQLIATHDAIEDRRNEFGTYYRVEGELIGVNGVNSDVITVWIIQNEIDDTFRFVTLRVRKRITFWLGWWRRHASSLQAAPTPLLDGNLFIFGP